ncbi:glycosyltransferase 25 family member [Tribolium castaneum]|uniref:Glycosyltransferase 25 family member-like Protein n=1 Tax=Tribolium castaneum TaxID=7070 RepID=D6WGI3_TRICA|nr:PREDICTED: glycosyltransferase 25 family member [Tribolium castaneum]EFA00173.1 Glycosyltransferase 25 family member-like Protein [Tribolium castaneum]|eukprot:XP_970300.1 PREDICTED: glycosyltransferase 25 family member [Tribolium castaneum]
MFLRFAVLCLVLCLQNVASEWKKPTVLIAVLARNKAHTLPYFLTTLENLDYPKNRISLWIRSDHNSDKTIEILRKWINAVKDEYRMISTEFVEENEGYPDESGPAHWTPERFNHVIDLRESSLNFARKIWADYYWTIDCDVFLTNPKTLDILISKGYTVVAPMLKSDGLYSNFWYGMTDDYYYQRTEDYKPVVNRENIGCFNVPMVHSCVLVDLRRQVSDFLTYDPDKVPNFDGPIDDIITFAIGANRSGISLNLCNDERFGFVMLPLEQDANLAIDFEQLTNIKLEVLTEEKPLNVSKLLEAYTWLPEKDTLGFDKIFMINLLRRPERRQRMRFCFDELGLQVTIVDAVDGRALNASILQQISPLPEYADPYHKRPMTLGEIGCFLSHYNIWKDIVRNGYETTLVLEDDIRFESFFRTKVLNVMDEVKRVSGWDLVYLGRKRLQEDDEPWVEGSSLLVEAGYSYWTLGYVLSLNGAKKLLNADPLSRLVPVDEYLPILFDKHPQTSWKGYFPKRNLVALSAAPLLVYPTHYTGEQGYISDTEDSVIIKENGPRARDDL